MQLHGEGGGSREAGVEDQHVWAVHAPVEGPPHILAGHASNKSAYLCRQGVCSKKNSRRNKLAKERTLRWGVGMFAKLDKTRAGWRQISNRPDCV